MLFENIIINFLLIIIPLLVITIALFFYDIFSFLNHKKQINQMRVNAFDAIELERKRIANELHDISAFSLLKIKQNISKGQHLSVNDLGNELMNSIHLFQDEINFSIENLYPCDLLINDWESSIRSLCQSYLGILNIDCSIHVSTKLEKTIAIQFYRIIQEHITNIIKHAGPSFVQIFIDEIEKEIFVEFLYPKSEASVLNNRKVGKGRGKLILNERYLMLNMKHSKSEKSNMQFEKLNFKIK